jgi:hypothetical protein
MNDKTLRDAVDKLESHLSNFGMIEAVRIREDVANIRAALREAEAGEASPPKEERCPVNGLHYGSESRQLCPQCWDKPDCPASAQNEYITQRELYQRIVDNYEALKGDYASALAVLRQAHGALMETRKYIRHSDLCECYPMPTLKSVCSCGAADERIRIARVLSAIDAVLEEK